MDRLQALVRQYEMHGADRMHIADIGADHGYLSQRILNAGFRGKLIVTDIAEKPLAVAKRNLGDHAQIEYRLCSGLGGDFSETQMIFIAGMGGDLIADILAQASSLREDALFVLQPMTHFEKVYRALKDRYLHSYFASEREKYYRIMVFGGKDAASASAKELCSKRHTPAEDSTSRAALNGHTPAEKSLLRPAFPEKSPLCLTIPWLRDFSETMQPSPFDDGGEERVLTENLEDAFAFFENRRRQLEGIMETAGKSGNPALHSRCIYQRRRIEEILRILIAAPED